MVEFEFLRSLVYSAAWLLVPRQFLVRYISYMETTIGNMDYNHFTFLFLSVSSLQITFIVTLF